MIGHPAAERAEALASLQAPDVRLPTVDGSDASVYDFSGRKRLVVSFASWCGCRYDLPAWQQLQERYADQNFSVVAVAVDESADAVQPWVDEANPTYPVLVDADHTFVDAYGIRNVPTVVWIDENDHIVRPNSPEFGNDQFIDFHGRPSGPHLEALERWIVHGEKPYESDAAVRAEQFMPDENQQLARAEYRLAVELWRGGEKDLAERHFVRGGELAPYDFTIRRGSMPLRGQDPFGELRAVSGCVTGSPKTTRHYGTGRRSWSGANPGRRCHRCDEMTPACCHCASAYAVSGSPADAQLPGVLSARRTCARPGRSAAAPGGSHR